jgi:pirin-like protein
MLKKRASSERGHGQYDWLDTYHTFSFNDYHDPDYMGFQVLRVMNEDRVQPGQGFGTHGHRDMEIITYVLDRVAASYLLVIWARSDSRWSLFQPACLRLQRRLPDS